MKCWDGSYHLIKQSLIIKIFIPLFIFYKYKIYIFIFYTLFNIYTLYYIYIFLFGFKEEPFFESKGPQHSAHGCHATR